MIEGLNVRLRVLETKDAPIILNHWNDLELRSFLSYLTPDSLQSEEEFIKSTWQGFRKNSNFIFGIETVKDSNLIGSIGLHSVDWINSSAELGIVIWDKNYHSKGYGTEAAQLLLFYAFEILNLNRVQLRVYEYNTRAIKSYEKIGFKKVGTWRKAKRIYNKFYDVVLMDILVSEFCLPKELDTYLTKKYRHATIQQ